MEPEAPSAETGTDFPLTVAELAFFFVREQLGVTRREMESPRRQGALVEARALFVWIVRTHRPHLSLTQIGRLLGGRDHSTILNLFRKALELRRRDPDFDILCRRFAAVFTRNWEKYDDIG